MDLSEVQVQNAIEIAGNPYSDQNLKAQAYGFVTQLRSNPGAAHVCLSLFVRDPPLSDVVRLVSLEVTNHAVESDILDKPALDRVRDGLLQYVRTNYGSVHSRNPVDTPPIQNKLAQTLTYLFEYLYKSGWETFFQDLRAISADGANHAGTLLYLRVLASVHDEIADQLIHTKSADRQKLFVELKDLIRNRDIVDIAASWQSILSDPSRVSGLIIEMCLKTISRWVGWTDITLIVNEATMNQLFDIASRNVASNDEQNVNVRDAAIDVFTEVVAKKMKPSDKIGLIQFLNLNEVVNRLTLSPGLSETRGRPDYDTDMAETVAKLVNGVMLDLVKILDGSEASGETRTQAEVLVQQFVPHLLRFFADEYDEVCSTVIPSLTDFLGLFRKLASSRGGLIEPYNQMVQPILDAIISKMRYDDTSSWGEEGDETDEAEFQELRKRLRVLQQLVATADETLYIQTLSNIVTTPFSKLKAGTIGLDWRDVDLAMLEMSLLGELALVNGGLYHKRRPSSVASETLIQLMTLMLESDVARYPHATVSLRFMDICVKHTSYFEQHSEFVPNVLEHFVGFVHSSQVKVKARSQNYFLRLVRDLKPQLGSVAERAIQAIQDLMVIKAEVPEEASNDDSSSNGDLESADAVFSSQLNLFEAVGCMASALGAENGAQGRLIKSTLVPLTNGISAELATARHGDERAILQVHHLVMAAGTLARGFSDWVPGKSRPAINEWVGLEFTNASALILDTLESLKSSVAIRSAARFTFSRMIGVLGYGILQQLPRLIDGLLAESSTKDEMATFLKLLDQVIFGFKTQISPILDNLFTPLLQRIFQALSEATNGTDDEIQLGELRREYLNFLLVVLGNDLSSVVVSSANQGIFDTIVSSVEHFARDVAGNPDARLAMAVLTKMSLVWGGPDIKSPSSDPSPPQPSLPGFDHFMLTRFSALTWQIMSAPTFDPKEANANRSLAEIALLQQVILAKTGQRYLTWLRENELNKLGANDAMIDEYINALMTKDSKAFKAFIQSFLHQGRS